MRYSVTGVTAKQLQDAGGLDIKETSTGIIFATLDPEQAKRLEQQGGKTRPLGDIKAAVMPPVPVMAAPAFSPEYLVWAAGLDDARQITDPPLYGRGFNVAVIDTGIRDTHQKIAGRVVYRKNFTDAPMRDGFNHGTGVASIVLSVAPQANILDLKVLGDSGVGTEEEVVLAIDEALILRNLKSEFAPHILNLSLGSPDDGDPDNPVRVACRAAIDKGIWIFAAAGNFGPDADTIMTPACERYVAAVGSAKYQPFVVSDFSSRGPTGEGFIKPDGLFFGEDIVMASSESDEATIAKSGTSFAAPFVSGIAALYQEGVLAYGGVRYPEGPPPGIFPEITDLVSIEQVLDKYLAGLTVKPQGTAVGKDNAYGYGLPFGPLWSKAFTPQPASGFSEVIPMLSSVMALGMVGMMMRGALSGSR